MAAELPIALEKMFGEGRTEGVLDMAGSSAGVNAWSSRRKVVAAVGLLIVLAPPVAAESRNNCHKMARQIGHYQDVRADARSRGDDLWRAGTEQHIARLEVRYRRLCPEYLAAIERSKIMKATAETKQFIRAAAKAAARYFTFGF